MSDSNFKEKYRDRLRQRIDEASTVRKIVAIVLTTLIVILVVGGVSGYLFVKSALEPVDPGDESSQKVEIPMGSSTSEIATILEENDIIKNSMIFRFYTKFNNITGFQAGDYQFTQSMSLGEIAETLQTGRLVKDPALRVTIPEGQTLEEIAATYAEEMPFTKEEFMKKVNDKEFIQKMMERYPNLLTDAILQEGIRYPLEGYLFAATYPYYVEDPSIETIVTKMLDETKSIVLPKLEAMKKLEEKENVDLNVHKLITLASLVENEARTAENRKMIAEVFYNRLEEGMPLQTDPTVAYAHDKHLSKVLYEDLEIESPYNTYHVDGLPIGPISNFNKNSLHAVLNPKESEYLYFLADGEGNIHYSKTLEQHNKYKEKYIN